MSWAIWRHGMTEDAKDRMRWKMGRKGQPKRKTYKKNLKKSIKTQEGPLIKKKKCKYLIQWRA